MARHTGSSARDRTSEFHALVEKAAKQEDPRPVKEPAQDGPSTSTNSAVNKRAQQAEFMKRAGRIGHGISSTASKLQKLSQLAKRTSVFDDPAEEINELTGLIKQDIQALNSAITDLQSFSADNNRSDAGANSRQGTEHAKSVVDSLRARLKDATKDFRDVLTNRTQNLKQHQERRQLFSNRSAASGSLFGEADGLLLAKQNSSQVAVGEDAARQGGGAGFNPSAGPLMQQSMMQVQDSYLTQRNEAIRNVESTITELGGIFQQLAHMVQEQGEMAIRIDENLDDTLMNVDNAQMSLMKYLQSVSSNRWLVMQVMMVLAVFVVMFVVFLA